MKPRIYLVYFLCCLFLIVDFARAQQFEISSVVSYKPGAAVGIKLKGTWSPSLALSAESSALPQVIVFSARDKKKPEQRFKLAASSFPTSPDDEAFRIAVAKQLDLSRKAFSDRGEFPHYATLVYNPNVASSGGVTTATIAQAYPCLVSEEAIAVCFGDEKLKRVVWVEATLDAGGTIQNVSIENKGVNVEPLHEAIEASLKLWKFTPATENGVSVASTIRFPLPFVVGWEPPKPFDANLEYWLTLFAIPTSFHALDQWPRLVSVAPLKPANLSRTGSTQGFDVFKPLIEYPILVDVKIDSQGELSLTPRLTIQRPLVEMVAKGLSGWRFTPPLHGGKPCSVEFTASVSMVPRSALEGAAPKSLYSVGSEYPEEYYELVEETLPSAARPALFPTSSTRIPPSSTKRDWPDQSRKFEATTQSRDIINQAQAKLPMALHKSSGFARLHGAVEMALAVDSKGNVVQATITKSKSPIFDAPALWAIYARQYLPLANGTAMRQIAAEVDFGRWLGGPSLLSFDVLSPANAKPDAPITFSRVSPPVFPRTVPASVLSGRATADVHVDELGRVIQVDIVEASMPEFGFALRAALEASQFAPIVCAGKPVPAILRRPEIFERPSKSRDSLVLVLDAEDRETVTSQELDRPLSAIVTQSVVFPLGLIGHKQSGEAVIEIIINRIGRACEPTIVSASEPEFGYAAVQAASSWNFVPPTKHGVPVSVKVRTTLRFVAPTPAAD